jgi:biopolymer transport protein ExbD
MSDIGAGNAGDFLQPVNGAPGGTARPEKPGSSARRRRGGLQRRDALHQWSMHFGPNMTPMVDVVMVILIFFMASAAFLGSEWFLRAAIPFEAGRGTNASKKSDPLEIPPLRLDVVLDVDPSGKTVVSFGELNRASIEDFQKRINAFPRDESTRKLEVLIRPSTKVPYRDVVRVHAACDEIGISKVGIGVARTGTGGGSSPSPSGPVDKP